jgi:hypothetical protein
MKTAKIIAFISFVFYGLLTLYYSYVFYSLQVIYQEANAARPFPWLILFLAFLAVADFVYFLYLRNKTKRNENLTSAWLISILLLVVPFVLFIIMAFISGNGVLQNLTHFS